MKKTYINPVASVIKVHAAQLLAGTTNLGLGEAGSANDAESRRGGSSVWDDDEE